MLCHLCSDTERKLDFIFRRGIKFPAGCDRLASLYRRDFIAFHSDCLLDHLKMIAFAATYRHPGCEAKRVEAAIWTLYRVKMQTTTQTIYHLLKFMTLIETGKIK